jgi:type I restriction enzyme S subunit
LENIESWTGRFIPTETEFEGEGIAFDAGDILFGKLRPYLAKALRAGSSGEAVGDFHVMRPVAGINSRFAQYQILNREFIAIVDGSTFGSKMPRASWEFVGGMKVTTPPQAEQKSIAAFLDQETAKIDELVAEQQRLMELLKEKRQAVISHAVTKGLNPKAALKPSGIEWLGDVPEHWEVMSLRRCCSSVQTGGTPSNEPPSIDLEQGMVWYTPGDFGDSLYLTTSTRKISAEAVASGEAKVFPPKSVLIVSIGATLGKIGFAVEPSSANQQINAVIPNEKIDGYFLAYSLLVKTEVMRFLSNASTIGIMNQEKTKDIWLAVPPRKEQNVISAFLDTEIAKLDTLTAEAQRAIDLLQERRTALISAAVTGQIDVRKT